MQPKKELLVPVPARAKKATVRELSRLARKQRPRLTLSEYVRQVLDQSVLEGSQTMVGVRVPVAAVARYHALARADHRKLTDVLRFLLDGWAEQMEAKQRIAS